MKDGSILRSIHTACKKYQNDIPRPVMKNVCQLLHTMALNEKLPKSLVSASNVAHAFIFEAWRRQASRPPTEFIACLLHTTSRRLRKLWGRHVVKLKLHVRHTPGDQTHRILNYISSRDSWGIDTFSKMESRLCLLLQDRKHNAKSDKVMLILCAKLESVVDFKYNN